MELVLDREQQELGATVRKFLADRAPMERVRQVMETDAGYDAELWQRLGGELALTGLVVPETYGGVGAGHVERSVVLEEFGRALLPSPYLASAVLAVDALLASGDTGAQAEYLPRLATGELIAAVGLDGDALTATRAGDEWVLDGCLPHVLSGELAGVLLVPATTAEGTGWFLVTPGADGLRRTPLRTLDPTSRVARISCSATPARSLAGGDGAAALARVRDLAAVAVAAERLGGMRQVLEATADYAKVRVQFGRAIGSYQAVKHTLADMYSTCEQATSLVRYAAWAADHDPAELPLAAAAVQLFTGPAYFRAAADGLQLHGGIGYTWEHDAHLYYKRAKTQELLLGTAEAHRGHLADLLNLS